MIKHILTIQGTRGKLPDVGEVLDTEEEEDLRWYEESSTEKRKVEVDDWTRHEWGITIVDNGIQLDIHERNIDYIQYGKTEKSEA